MTIDKALLARLIVPGLLVLLCIVLGAISPVFLSTANLINVLLQASIIAVVAVGMTWVIITEGIDLSVGSIVALSSVTIGILLDGGRPMMVAISGGLLAGGACGLVNGLVISLGRVNPFVATLGMMSAARGLALLLTDGRSVSGFGSELLWISDGRLFGLPAPVVIMLGVALLAAVALRYTRWGQYAYAIGDNRRAAWLSGIRVRSVITSVYVLSGLLSAVAALLLTARLNSAQPVAGVLYELDAIAAAVIGGASLSGGRGTVVGTIVGALILAVLKNGLSILGVSSYLQQIAIGVVIVAAMLVDQLLRRTQP